MGHREAKRIRKELRKEVERNMGEFFKMVEEFSLKERLSLAYRIVFKKLRAKKYTIGYERKGEK